MPNELFETVPNVSEGRDSAKIERFAQAIKSGGVRLLDYSADADHNRSVYTLVGTRAQLRQSLLNLTEQAVKLIDMRNHSGVHPCVGALDVLPIIPLQNTNLAQAKDFALQMANLLWERFSLPSLLYDYQKCGNRLADFRKHGLAGLSRCKFDVGNRPHPTAGAVAIAARDFLIAYNVNLLGGDIRLARQIARAIRESSGGFSGVKALGLYLPEQNKVQVSMNITDYRKTPPRKVYDKIAELVGGLGVVLESELIGLMPSDALSDEDYVVMGLEEEMAKKIQV